MLRYILSIMLLLISGLSFAAGITKNVTVIMPMQHQALDEIVSGFSQGLKRFYHGNVNIKIYNAQGDYNIQNSMVQQAKQQPDIDLVVAVTTTVLQSASAIIKERPVLGIASSYTDKERTRRNPRNVTALQDEIKPEYSMRFLREVFPGIEKIAVVYSNNDKSYKEVDIFTSLCRKYGIKLQKLSVPSLAELYSISRVVDKDTEAIYILKDNLIASGVETLSQQAKLLGIPLVTSDEGTVIKGADISLGVVEKDIGIRGATIAARILEGEDIAQIPVQFMSDLYVFYNKESMLDKIVITNAAKELGYNIKVVGGK